MKVKDILKQKHTILPSVSGNTYHHLHTLKDYTQINVDLNTILFVIGKQYSEPIELLRKMTYHSKEQIDYKENFPAWFVGGTFPLRQTADKDILTYSNILAIDVDKKDNPDIDIELLRQKLFELPYVFAVLKSISGEGIYVLILLEDGKYTKDYYKYIDKLWYQEYKINIDHQCTNIGRKRFISYESDIQKWVKSEDDEIQPWKLKYIERKQEQQKIEYVDCSKYKTNEKSTIEFCRKAIWKLLNSGYSIDKMRTLDKYGVWYHVGCDFRLFDDGYEMFVKFSTNSSNYNDSISIINKKWQNTKLEDIPENICKKWCGICKNTFGKDWFRS